MAAEKKLEDCPICLVSLGRATKTVKPFECLHAFHNKCVKDWIEQSVPPQWNALWVPKSCPLCRCDKFRQNLPKEDALACLPDKIVDFVANQALGDGARFVRADISGTGLVAFPSQEQLVLLGYYTHRHANPLAPVDPVLAFKAMHKFLREAVDEPLARKMEIYRIYCVQNAAGKWTPDTVVAQPCRKRSEGDPNKLPLPPLSVQPEGQAVRRLCYFDSALSEWRPEDGVIYAYNLYVDAYVDLTDDIMRDRVVRYLKFRADPIKQADYDFCRNIVNRFALHVKCLRIPHEYDDGYCMHAFVRDELRAVFHLISDKWKGQGPMVFTDRQMDNDMIRTRFKFLHLEKYSNVLLAEPIAVDDCLPLLKDALERGLAKKKQAFLDKKAAGTWSIPNQRRWDRIKAEKEKKEEPVPPPSIHPEAVPGSGRRRRAKRQAESSAEGAAKK